MSKCSFCGLQWPCACQRLEPEAATPTQPPPGAQHPPRLWGGPDLLEENRKVGAWCAFEVKFKEDDTEYLSLSEHSALLSQAAAKARAETWRAAAEFLPRTFAFDGYRQYMMMKAEGGTNGKV